MKPQDKKIARMALEEMARRVKNKQYQQRPDLWLAERFGEPSTTLKWSEWPGYEAHEWDGTKDPFFSAFESLAQKGWVGIESATSTGKTYLLPRIVYWFLDVFPNALVVTTAPKQQQLKAVLWSEMAKCFHKFKRIRPRAEMFSLRVLPDGTTRLGGGDGEELTDMHMAIGVVSGVSAGEESATKMQGYHRENMLFVVEEAAGVPPPVFTAIKNTCTGENNLVISVGNPDAVTDALHQFCELGHVNHIRISALDHPNVVLNRTVIPGAVTPRSIEVRAAEYGEESNFFKSRIRGIAPLQATDALITYESIVKNCTYYRDKYVPVPDDASSYNALGVDVANSIDGDKAALAWGRGNALVSLHEFACPNANHIADNVVRPDGEIYQKGINHYATEKVQDYGIDGDHIGVDAVGVGVGTINQFADLNYYVKGLQGGVEKDQLPTDGEGNPLYTFTNMRAQMWFQARLDLMNGTVRLEIQDRKTLRQLIKELTTPKFRLVGGAVNIESKESIKKRLGGASPNLGDAFVYWNWVRKNRGEFDGALPLL